MRFALFQGRIDQTADDVARKPNWIRAIMFACPLFFTGFVAVKARTSTDTFDLPAGSPAQDAQALAYAPFVQQSQALLYHGDLTPEKRVKVLALCRQWDAAVQRDQLTPVFPISFEDSPEEGARGSIFRAKGQLVAFLLTDANHLFHEGKSRPAIEETLLAMRLSESLKYSDFTAVNLSAGEQKRAIEMLSRNLSQLGPQDREKIRGQIKAIIDQAPNLAAMTRFSRIQYYDWLKRSQQQDIAITDVHRVVLLTDRIASDPTSKVTLQYVKRSYMDSPDEDRPEYLSQMRIACSSSRSNIRDMQELARNL